MTPPITILLVTLGRRDLLELALWHVYETSTAEERDLWIWDNASEDDTPDFLGTLVGWPGVRVFRSKDNVGLVEPRRRMIPHVRTPHVLTLDDDVWLLSRGWASGVSRVLGADASIGQLALALAYDRRNDYGIAHADLDRPFFRVPPIRPGPRSEAADFQSPDAAVMASTVPGCAVVSVAGENVAVPVSGARLPFSVSGSASAWRVADLLPLLPRAERHPVVDLHEAWGIPLEDRGLRSATMAGYRALHPSPGPLWHLGRGESYWGRRCGFAEAIYGRSGDVQRSWLEAARRASGWGRSIEDPDVVLE